MATPIQSPTKCDVRSVIRFLNAKGERPTEIQKQIVVAYGIVMNQKNVAKWCREFSKGRTDVHDEQRSGRPSVISDDLLQEFEGEIRANLRVTIREFHYITPEVSKTTIHEAVTEKLGYRELCARWVPKMLTDDHKTKRMGSVLKFLTRYAQDGDDFHLFLHLKKHLAGKSFEDEDEVQEKVMAWFKGEVVVFYD
jgi:transposase